jgi:CHAD domain-containing protein
MTAGFSRRFVSKMMLSARLLSLCRPTLQSFPPLASNLEQFQFIQTRMPIDRNRVVKPFLQVRKSLSRIPKDPGPEQIHKLRTRMRRIEAVVDALGPDLRGSRRLLRQEKPFRRRLGKVRDMDVLTGLATSLQPDPNDESIVELLEYLGAERYRQARRLRADARQDGPKFIHALKRFAAQLEQRAGYKASNKAKAEAAAAVAASALVLSKQLSGYPPLRRSNLHEFRLQVKHLRYILQMATESETALLHDLGEVKDKIGEWHDWEQLTEVARAAAQDGSHGLITQLAGVARGKYKEALRLSQQLRRRHFTSMPAVKKTGGLVRPAPVAEVANSLLAA